MVEVVSWAWLLIALPGMVLLHELGHLWAARWMGVRVLEFGMGFGPSLASWRSSDIRWRINMIPLGGYVKLHLEGSSGLAHLNDLRQAILASAGVFVNIAAGVVIVVAALMLPTDVLEGDLLVRDVIKDSPADRAGIRMGDVILEIDGADVRSLVALRDANDRDRSAPLAYRVLRATQELTVEVAPINGHVGVVIETVNIEVVGSEWRSPVQGLRDGLHAAWRLTVAPYAVLFQGGTLNAGERMEITGPVKLAIISSEAVKTGGLVMALLITGGLSIHMGLLNMLPLPGLDGGQLLFLGIGAARGRPVPWRIRQAAGMLGIALLMGLMTAVLILDIISLGVW